MPDRLRQALTRLFDAAATVGYLLFGVPLLILAVFMASSLQPFGLLLGGILGVTGGGAVLAAVQTWRREPKALSGPALMVAGIVAYTVFMVWAFTNGRFGP